jgi:hypothetical protein
MEKSSVPMKGEEAQIRLQCSWCKEDGPGACGQDGGHDCVMSASCSILCHSCGERTYFEGSYSNAPSSFGCVHCGRELKNKYSELEG